MNISTKIKINYKLTIYQYKDGYHTSIDVIDNLTEEFDSNTLFPDMIDYIIKKHKIVCTHANVEKLKTKTWNKIISEDLYNCTIGNDYQYEWFNYKLNDIQKTFKLFDEPINIIINGVGIGGGIGTSEGIVFIINNNEKDRHQYEPHVHCKYSGEEMRIRIDTLEIMKDDKIFKNKKKVKRAIKWISEHQEALLKYYNSFAIEGDSSIKFEGYG